MVRQTGAISISVDTKRAENMFTGLIKTIPEGARIGAKKLAGIYAQKYLDQMPRAGIEPWTGQSFDVLAGQITNPPLLSRNPTTYGVIVPGNLISLDQMSSHTVALKSGRSITRWAQTKLGKTSGFIFVHKHPWIDNANRNARRKIGVVAQEVNKKIRRKGTR